MTAVAEGPTSIHMSWEPPPANWTNGEITYYKVFKVQANKSDSSADMAVVKNQTKITLDELQKWTEYRLWVLAGTTIGDGPISSPITVRTLEDGTQPLFSLRFDFKVSIDHVSDYS